MKKNQFENGVFTIENFLTADQCESLIVNSEYKGYNDLFIDTNQGPKIVKTLKTNLSEMNDLSISVDSVLSILDAEDQWSPYSIDSQLSFYKYSLGLELNEHTDEPLIISDTLKSKMTLMIFLNESFKGGEILFDEFKIKPKKGMALFFPQSLPHKGKSVIKGQKYAMKTNVIYKKCV